jgi:hypothetical protein
VSKRPRLSANLRVRGKGDVPNPLEAATPEIAAEAISTDLSAAEPEARTAELAMVEPEAVAVMAETAPVPAAAEPLGLAAAEAFEATAASQFSVEPMLLQASPVVSPHAIEPREPAVAADTIPAGRSAPEPEAAATMKTAPLVPEPAPAGLPEPEAFEETAMPEPLAEPFSFQPSRLGSLRHAFPFATATSGESLGTIVGDAALAMSFASCAGFTHALVLQFRLTAYMLNAMRAASGGSGLKLGAFYDL